MPRDSFSLESISTIPWHKRPSLWMQNGRYAGDGNKLFVNYVWITATALLFFGIMVAVGSFTFAWTILDMVFLAQTWRTMLGQIFIFLASLVAIATAILMGIANRTKGSSKQIKYSYIFRKQQIFCLFVCRKRVYHHSNTVSHQFNSNHNWIVSI